MHPETAELKTDLGTHTDTDSDTDSYPEDWTDTDSDEQYDAKISDAKMIIKVFQNVLMGDEPESALTVSALGMLFQASRDFEESALDYPIQELADISFEVCRIIVNNKSINYTDELVKSIIRLIQLTLSNILGEDKDSISQLAGKRFVGCVYSAVKTLKAITKKSFKSSNINESIYYLSATLDQLKLTCLNHKASVARRESLFSVKKPIDFLTRNEMFITADHYFEDWDETLYDFESNRIYSGLNELINIASDLGVQHHIITARHGLIEWADEYLLYNDVKELSTMVKREEGFSIHEHIHKANLNKIYTPFNIIYCNFHTAELENGRVTVVDGKRAKVHKISDYEQYCELKGIDASRALVFDDKPSVWEYQGKSIANLQVVNNNKPKKSTFTKMLHAVSQRVLYNEAIDHIKRTAAAMQLLALIDMKGGLHLDGLTGALRSFIGVQRSPSHPS